MYEFLDSVISFIQTMYKQICEEWNNKCEYNSLNYRKNLVRDINKNNEIFISILNYRDFVNDKNMDLLIDLEYLYSKNTITARVKSQNSIEYKIENYIKNHNEGKESINKCFNDIYGIRIIFEENIDYEDIRSFINEKYPKLKCINSSKQDYVATHIYFKQDNFSFPWELQIWDRNHEMRNIISHERYKQEYKKWESENKGGK